jgi:RHS repeat-associated protein
MPMPGRKFVSSGEYRFGFNGKENDNEFGAQDFGDRIYDGRIAVFLSIDPLSRNFPHFTPYGYAFNRPIDGIDNDGNGWIPNWMRFWESKEMTAARNFADIIGGTVEKQSRHHAIVKITDQNYSYWYIKYKALNELNKNGANIDYNMKNIDMDLEGEIISQITTFVFDETGAYKNYFNPYVGPMLAQNPAVGIGVLLEEGLTVFLPPIEVGSGVQLNSLNFDAAAIDAANRVLNSSVYAPDNELKNDPRTGGPVIDDEAAGTYHTQTGKQTSSNKRVGDYAKRRTITPDGKVEKEIDHTDHGRPQNHPNPHQHTRDKETGERGDAEPVSND